MHRTVHVRTVFPSGSAPARTVLYSRSGQGADARSLFFVLRDDRGADAAAGLASAVLSAGAADLATLAAVVDGALPGVVAERDLALFVVDPPLVLAYVTGRGLVGVVTDGGVRVTEPGWTGVATLGTERVGAGHGWRAAARVGDSFVLGLADDVARLTPADLRSLPSWLERSSRAHPIEGALAAISAGGGGLVVGRLHHVAGAPASRPPAPPPKSPSRVRASLGNALALAIAVAAFVALVEAGPTDRSDSQPGDRVVATSWRRVVPEPGAGRPVWLGDVLAVTRRSPRPTLDFLDPATGTTVRSWALDVADPHQPIRAGGRLVVTGGGGATVALDVESGATTWTASFPGGITATAAMEDRLWVAAGGRLIGLDAASGRVRFDVPIEGDVVGVDVTRGIGVLVTNTGDVHAFDPNAGRTLWSHAGRDEPAFGPSIVRGRVYVVEAAGRVSCYHVGRGRREWESDVGAVLVTPPARWGDGLFVGTADGRIIALDRNDGHVTWRSSRRNHRPLSLVVEDDDLFVVEEGAIVPLDARSGERRPALRHDGSWEWSVRARGLWIGGNRSGEIGAVSPGSIASNVADEQAG